VPDAPDVPDVPDVPAEAIDSTMQRLLAGTGLTVFSDAGMYDAPEREAMAAELEQAMIYVAERVGSIPAEPMTLSIHQDAGCSLHGIAYTNQRQLRVTTCADLPRYRVVNLMAHEIAHQIAHDRYGPPHLHADMILLEGLATWGAGTYWLGGLPSFRDYVREHYTEDRLLPLATSYVGRPIADMNMLYYEWASFVEFLLETYGRAPFDHAYITGEKAPGTADYQGGYGKDLATLEAEWRAWLRGE
jgi:hypothetical protein